MEEKQRKRKYDTKQCGKMSRETALLGKKRQWRLLDEDEKMEPSIVHHKKTEEMNKELIKYIDANAT